jgi:hypothetical protein
MPRRRRPTSTPVHTSQLVSVQTLVSTRCAIPPAINSDATFCFVTSTLCAATFCNSYVKWGLRYVMLRFVAVPHFPLS